MAAQAVMLGKLLHQLGWFLSESTTNQPTVDKNVRNSASELNPPFGLNGASDDAGDKVQPMTDAVAAAFLNSAHLPRWRMMANIPFEREWAWR